jgi:hypothetical protein
MKQPTTHTAAQQLAWRAYAHHKHAHEVCSADVLHADNADGPCLWKGSTIGTRICLALFATSQLTQDRWLTILDDRIVHGASRYIADAGCSDVAPSGHAGLHASARVSRARYSPTVLT